MPEILTESFCERCGTRYTFESASPGKTRKLGRFKTLSKGLKNYVMSDDTSLDEAMAAARSDDERETTSQQLDAFHSTFNFCMTCRQYTCGNCWNEVEGRCLTCAPHLGHEVLPAPFPDVAATAEPIRIDASAWPTADLSAIDEAAAAEAAAAEAEAAALEAEAAATAQREAEVAAAQEAEEPIDLAARFAGLTGDDETTEPIVDAPVAEPEPEPAAAVAEPEPEPVAAVAEPEPVAAEPEPVAAVAEPEPVAAEPEPEPVAIAERAAEPAAVDDVAAALAAHTSTLMGRFRPGQNIDEALAAYEAILDAAESAEPAAASAEPEPEPVSAVAAQAEPVATVEPDLVTAPEPEPVAPEPVAATAEPEPEPVAAATAEPEPEPVGAEPVREDRIEQPTWRIVAPEAPHPAAPAPAAPANGHPVEAPSLPPAASASPPPSGEPQWPSRPGVADSPALAILAERSAVRASGNDDLWAASNREVLAPPTGAPVTAGVQPCSNCGLSLSASARFCRRCGTRQG